MLCGPEERTCSNGLEALLEAPFATVRGGQPESLSPTKSLELHDALRDLAATRVLCESELPADPLNSNEGHSYKFLSLIGQGGMGQVWTAYQTSLRRVVAVKRPIPRDDGHGDARNRLFIQEAFTTAQLDHPNIVPVHDLGVTGQGDPLMAMKLVRGRPWHDLIATEPPDIGLDEYLARHLRILLNVAQATAFAHSRGIVHRDIKPSQVVIGEFGEVLLMDWGLALCLAPERLPDDVPGEVVEVLPCPESATSPAGTAVYIAPEQFRRDAMGISERTDVFLLGTTLYHILSRQPPRRHLRGLQLETAIVQGNIDPLPTQWKEEALPEELVSLIVSCTQREPEDRCPSALEFVRCLEEYLAGSRRIQESRELAQQAARRLSATCGYHEFAECLSLLGKARTLWPGNFEAQRLRDQALECYAYAANSNGDLILARAQAESISKASLRLETLTHVEAAEAKAQWRERVRRALLVATLLLLITIAAITAISSVLLSKRKSQAEYATIVAQQQTARAEATSQDLARELYRSSIGLAARLVEGGQPHQAQRPLAEAPLEHRHIEWSMLHAMAKTSFADVPLLIGPLRRVVWSAQEDCLFALGLDGRIAKLEMQDGSIAILDDLPTVLALAASPDASQIAFLVRDSLIIRGANGSEQRYALDGIEGNGIVWNGVLVLYAEGGQTWTCDLQSGSFKFLAQFPKVLSSFATDPSGTLVAGGLTSGDIVLRSLSDGAERRLSGHGGSICSLEFDPSGTILLSASLDTTVRSWEVPGGSLRRVVRASNEVDIRGAIHRALFAPASGSFYVCGGDGRAQWIDAVRGISIGSYPGHGGAVRDAVLLPSYDLLATVADDGVLRFWELQTDAGVDLPGHRGRVVARGISRTGSVATFAHDNTVRLFSAAKGDE